MIEAALRYQTKGEDWVKRVLIGGGAAFLAFLVFLPIFTVYGYMLEIIRRVFRGDTANPPEWGDYDIVQLSINGAKGFAILFVYGLVVGLVTLLPAGVLFLLGAVLQSPVVSLLGTLIGGLLYLVGVIIIAVIAPIMVCNFVLTDELSAGFDIDVLQTLITNGTMLRAVGLAIVVNFLISIVSGILFFTIVGPAIVSFVGLSAVAYIWASGFADAYRAEYGDLPEIPEGPTKMGIDATAGAGTSAATSGAETATAGDGASTADATTAESATDESGSSDTDDDTSGPAPGDGQRWD